MNAFAAAQEKVDAAAELLKAAGVQAQQDVKEAWSTFFAASGGEVTRVRWPQYTDWFNDGEPCTFSVHDLQIEVNGEWIDSYDIKQPEDKMPEWYKNNPSSQKYWLEKVVATPAINAAMSLHESFIALGEVCKQVFGDHVQITCSPDNIEVAEYEHD